MSLAATSEGKTDNIHINKKDSSSKDIFHCNCLYFRAGKCATHDKNCFKPLPNYPYFVLVDMIFACLCHCLEDKITKYKHLIQFEK